MKDLKAFLAAALICLLLLAISYPLSLILSDEGHAQQQRAVDYVNASSGNIAAATATATLPAVANRQQFFTGFEITYGGGTSAQCVTGTLTGLIGGTESFTVCAPNGAAVGGVPIIVQQTTPLPANSNTAIVVSVPAITGGTNMTVNLHGYILQQ